MAEPTINTSHDFPLNSTPTAIAGRLAAALSAARLAAAETLRWFRAPGLTVTQKADRSPVTQADCAAESIIKRELLAAFPDDAFLGEESGSVLGTSGYEWIVDPIDGTKSFIRGVPLYATLIGCRLAGHGVLGVIAIPALDELVYAAAGGGAWHAQGSEPPTAARVSSRGTLAESLLCTSDFTSFKGRNRFESTATDSPLGNTLGRGDAARQRLEAACGVSRTWGDGYGYLLVATGRADVMVDPIMNPWDAAAVETVIHEAGGSFTDWQGRRRIDSGEGVASNGLVHAHVLDLLRSST